MSRGPFEYVRGAVHLPQLGLWLDAHHAVTGPERVFVSHAHSDHTARHREVILTAPTARLMQTRLGGKRQEMILPFGERRRLAWEERDFHLTLLPAGHVLGSAMALVEWDGGSLLHTGDFKLRPSLTAEFCDPSAAGGVDFLVMETTYGEPRYAFPPAESVWPEVVRFCRDALDAGHTPVLLGYSLGRCQETLRALEGAGFRVALHEAAWKLTKVYEEFGQRFPAHHRLEEGGAGECVLLCPPGALTPAFRQRLGPVRTAVLTGWAVEASCRYRSGTDAAFIVSDHASYGELIEFVRRLAPRRVFTHHGFAAEFASTLGGLGFDAMALGMDEQLELRL